ncbi:hypothetical protein V2J09_017148 [Rumex salicifolius]
MATVISAFHGFSASCALPAKFKSLSISNSISSQFLCSTSTSFSSTLSLDGFSQGCLSMRMPKRQMGQSIVCEAATTNKADSAAKRARQAEKRRLRNKARKSEVRTRMRKVLEELEGLRKKKDASSEEILPIEKLIAEAYSAIDKAVKTGTLHRNTGANRKSRLARRKQAVEIHHGWYKPASSDVSI